MEEITLSKISIEQIINELEIAYQKVNVVSECFKIQGKFDCCKVLGLALEDMYKVIDLLKSLIKVKDSEL